MNLKDYFNISIYQNGRKILPETLDKPTDTANLLSYIVVLLVLARII
jgi:hypothetical protein